MARAVLNVPVMWRPFVVGVVIAISTAARAEPSGYVETRANVGLDKAVDWLYSGAALDGGLRLERGWWFHGGLSVVARTAYGAINEGITVITPTVSWYALAFGVGKRWCIDGDSVCGLAGIDLGYRFDGPIGGPMVVPRVQLDVGGEHLRIRPGLEARLSDPGGGDNVGLDTGIGLTLAVAYQW